MSSSDEYNDNEVIQDDKRQESLLYTRMKNTTYDYPCTYIKESVLFHFRVLTGILGKYLLRLLLTCYHFVDSLQGNI